MSFPEFSERQKKVQAAELMRNKGIICGDFLFGGACNKGTSCPYMHVRNGEVRPLPHSICTFFNNGMCLRDKCAYFHGTEAQLNELRNSGAAFYRPQDHMKVAYPVTDATAPPVSLVPNPALQTCLPSSMSVPMSMPMTMPMTVPTTMPMTMPTSMPMTMPMMNMNYSMPYMVLQQPQVPMMNMNQMGFSYPFVQTVAPANPMSAPATYPTLYPGSTEEPSQPERH